MPWCISTRLGSRCVWRVRTLCVLVWCGLMLGSAGAATDKATDKTTATRHELGALRDRIEQLRREVEQTEGERADAADALRDTEQNISTVQRSLRDLGHQAITYGSELKRLEGRIRLAQARREEQQERLALLVRQRYMRGGNDALRLALNGENPATVARQLGYAGYVAQARAELIRAHARSLDELARLAATVDENKQRLDRVRATQVSEKQKLEGERRAHAAVWAQKSEQIQQQRKEIRSKERDEQRLTRLVQRLAALRPRPKAVPQGKSAPARGQIVDQVADARLAGVGFTRLRGRLALPVAGEIGTRFGAAREGGGPVWKGLFIRAGAGQGVRAVATGQVVFADWLRGFGNLIILDHGDDYLSLYSNNESLYKQAGESVRAGDMIASVGNTGGHERPGLYFELRHQGKPFDPLAWVAGK
ncbi:MAG: peptidase M23 [Betaproteobacteria bacterium]|nr:MAG: peptidase M23 [Betaproteobacteria bacterium]